MVGEPLAVEPFPTFLDSLLLPRLMKGMIVVAQLVFSVVFLVVLVAHMTEGNNGSHQQSISIYIDGI